MPRMKMHPTPTISMKTILKSDNKNTAIATLEELCSMKCSTQHITKTKVEEQGKGKTSTNDENKAGRRHSPGGTRCRPLDLITGKELTSLRVRT